MGSTADRIRACNEAIMAWRIEMASYMLKLLNARPDLFRKSPKRRVRR
jgi:hypothetical protein